MRAAVICIGLVLAVIAGGLTGCTNARAGEPRLANAVHGDAGPYLRATISEDGRRGTYETAVRRFTKASGGGPVIYLAGETHYAERSYFEELYRTLDMLGVVLYESIQTAEPPEAAALAAQPPAARTRRQLELLAVVLRFELEDAGRLPASLDELADHPDAPTASRLRERLIRDAWGRPILYEPARARGGEPQGFTLRSLGADGMAGGAGEDADLVATPEQADTGDVGHATAASIFQACRVPGLLSGDFVRKQHPPHWRRADALFEDVRDRMVQADQSEHLAQLVRPSQRLAALVAEFGPGPLARQLARLDSIDLVSHKFGRDLRTLDHASDSVVLAYRNDIVFEELRRVLSQVPPPESIGINYGAAHMPDLERRLRALGYEPDAELWLCAVRFDADAPGLGEEQSRLLRRTARAWSSKWAGRAQAPPRPLPANAP